MQIELKDYILVIMLIPKNRAGEGKNVAFDAESKTAHVGCGRDW